MRIDEYIRSRGGLVPTHHLLERGWDRQALRRAVAGGSIIRVRQGWYALPDQNPVLLQAARVGGRLTCSAAAAQLGLWTRTRNPPLHVAVPSHGSRLRHPLDHRVRLRSPTAIDTPPVTIHWDLGRGGTAFVVDAVSCLLDMARCEPAESVIAAADSAIRSGLISRGRWHSATIDLPARLRAQLGDVDPTSGSYLESIVRVRLHRIGIRPRTQVEFAPDLRVDFLIGERLAIEIDGRQHAEPEQFRVDRERDARLSILDCRCLRFTGDQVLREWPTVVAAIQSAIRRGDADGRRAPTRVSGQPRPNAG